MFILSGNYPYLHRLWENYLLTSESLSTLSYNCYHYWYAQVDYRPGVYSPHRVLPDKLITNSKSLIDFFKLGQSLPQSRH